MANLTADLDTAVEVERLLRAVDLPENRLQTAAYLRVVLDVVERETVEEMRAGGASWADVAVGLGTTRSAAQQRFGSR